MSRFLIFFKRKKDIIAFFKFNYNGVKLGFIHIYIMQFIQLAHK